MAFYKIDPWGEQRADLRAACMTARVINVIGAAWFKKWQQVNPEELLLFPDGDREPKGVVTAEGAMMMFKALAQMGGRVITAEEQRNERARKADDDTQDKRHSDASTGPDRRAK